MQNSLETWQKVWRWEPWEPRPLVLQQQVATAFRSSVLMLAEGCWVKKRKWLLQTMYIQSKPILGLPSVQHLLTQFKNTVTKREAPFGVLMGIKAYISCPDLWLPSSGLMQTCFQVFWLLLLSHWDNCLIMFLRIWKVWLSSSSHLLTALMRRGLYWKLG